MIIMAILIHWTVICSARSKRVQTTTTTKTPVTRESVMDTDKKTEDGPETWHNTPMRHNWTMKTDS